ncbi:MAG: hypothetical protein GY861_14380 [bacterium]|nr:hypothetical protein [bacterium]
MAYGFEIRNKYGKKILDNTTRCLRVIHVAGAHMEESYTYEIPAKYRSHDVVYFADGKNGSFPHSATRTGNNIVFTGTTGYGGSYNALYYSVFHIAVYQ